MKTKLTKGTCARKHAHINTVELGVKKEDMETKEMVFSHLCHVPLSLEKPVPVWDKRY